MNKTTELPPPPPGKFGWPWTLSSAQFPECMPNGQPWPKISIVTPSFNQGKYLEETIRSVLLQGYPNLEYIIIDGGSTDNTLKVIEKYADYLSYWISEPDNGQAHAINKGLQKTNGEIVAYINSDDVYMPYTFEFVARIFGEFDEIYWLTGFKTQLVDQHILAPVINVSYKFNAKFYKRGYHTAWLFGWNSQPCTFWKRSLMCQVGSYFDENLQCSFDIDMWIRMARKKDLYFVRAVLAAMRQHSEQKSKRLQLDYFEVEKRSKILKFDPLIIRRSVYFFSRVPLVRKILRRLLGNPQAKIVDWSVMENRWVVKNKRMI